MQLVVECLYSGLTGITELILYQTFLFAWRHAMANGTSISFLWLSSVGKTRLK